MHRRESCQGQKFKECTRTNLNALLRRPPRSHLVSRHALGACAAYRVFRLVSFSCFNLMCLLPPHLTGHNLKHLLQGNDHVQSLRPVIPLVAHWTIGHTLLHPSPTFRNLLGACRRSWLIESPWQLWPKKEMQKKKKKALSTMHCWWHS